MLRLSNLHTVITTSMDSHVVESATNYHVYDMMLSALQYVSHADARLIESQLDRIKSLTSGNTVITWE